MEVPAETLYREGASLVGFANLDALPAEVRAGLPRAISIAVALTPAVVAGLADGPSAVYYAEYNRVNTLLGRLAESTAAMLRGAGYQAIPTAATNAGIDPVTHSTPLPHKTVATRAGLGWIGKCALLVTERYGSAVRLTAVLTDAPLPPARPADVSRCGDCWACVDACPGRAASGKHWYAGLPREAFFDARACRRAAREMAGLVGVKDTICGVCMGVCPWTERYVRRMIAQ